MIGIVLNLPPGLEHYLTATPFPLMMSHALLAVGWIPIFGVLIWGLTHIWVDVKEEKFNHTLKYILLEVSVPQDAINTPKGMENFFTNLAGVKSGITWREHWLVGKTQAKFSFEIISQGGKISFIIRTQEKYRDLVEAAIYAQYPEAQIMQVDDYVKQLPTEYPNDEWDVFGGELVLSNKQYFPIRTYEDFEHQGEKDMRFKDPLLPMLELLGKIRPGEHFWLQIVVKPPESSDWVKEGAKYLNQIMGKEEKHKPSTFDAVAGAVTWVPFGLVKAVTGVELGEAHSEEKKKDEFKMFRLTPQERLQLEAVTEKISKTGWLTKIRYVYAGKRGKFRKPLFASGTKGMFAPFNHMYLNGLGMHGPSVPKDDYFWQAWSMPAKQKTLVSRYQGRKGDGSNWYILNAEELATLFHFPAADARTPVLTKLGARRSEAPTGLEFAGEGEPELPNWKRVQEEAREEERLANVEEPHFAVPTPLAPTGEPPRPQAPAPLPPGLEHVNKEPVDDDGAPPNLPI